MIYSDFDNNWLRLEILSRIANSFYQLTKGTRYRDNKIFQDGHIIFSVEHYENIEKENAIVSMILAWVEITIDSLVNTIIVKNIKERTDAIACIEKPRNRSEILAMTEKPKTELGCKIYILYGKEVDIEVLRIADKMAFIRNQIIHDKPYDVSSGEEDYLVSKFSSREEIPVSYKYDELEPILLEFENVLNLLMNRNYEDLDLYRNRDEYSLLKLIIKE